MCFFVARVPVLNQELLGKSIDLLKEMPARSIRGPGLQHEGLPQRMMALDQEGIPLVEALQIAQVRQARELPSWPAITLLARQHEIPNAINSVAQPVRLQNVRKEVIDVREVRGYRAYGNVSEAEEALPLLIPIQRVAAWRD